jgi:hypothetical protein
MLSRESAAMPKVAAGENSGLVSRLHRKENHCRKEQSLPDPTLTDPLIPAEFAQALTDQYICKFQRLQEK